ncbi:Rv2732c family membrane protein [Nocardia altamirensis]|uniref:Rv2732c family membrane protein n=1 Tax=Nocardia altamirensis TaxID=472158 RepID=UPI000B02C291
MSERPVDGHADRTPDGEKPETSEPTTGGSGSAAGTEPGDGTVDAGSAANHEQAERNEGSVNAVESSNFEQFRDDLDAVERRIAGEIDPGVRAMVVAGAVFVLLLSLVLPHAGGARGFDVLLGTDAARLEHIGLPSRIFVWFLVIFGVGFSTLALMTRRWFLAWIAVAGTAITSVFGVFSIWHRQTPGIGNYHGAGPAIGLILGTLAAIVLTFHWVRVVWSRTALQLAAEEQRRNASAAAEERDRRRLTGE